MKQALYIFTIAAILLTFTSCTREDDLNEIFIGKTWYMNGGIINGMKLNSEVKNFYTDGSQSAYYITFSQGTYHGALSSGFTFSGTWSADGKKHTINLYPSNNTSPEVTFDKQIYNILTSTTSYESGAEFLRLKKDGDNQIFFGSTR
ncbi:MAG: DUF4847 family protein [Bacteroidaceae bacterium]|nr:DUF4847 family protein [Bacteroidaceae bacterium]